VRHTVLMGDPTHFSVVGGANPHTRDRWGRRKSVDRALAIVQWQRMRALLEDLGLQVVVVPPDARSPGLVYPANAGFRAGDDFILSTLTPTRAAETPVYARIISELGLRTHRVTSHFEGEADLFPAGDGYLFTSGTVQRQRFVPRWGIPPWRRIYGFRSDAAALTEIERIHPLRRPIRSVRLADERYYHGDTCLCSFGPSRASLLAYMPVLSPESAAMLRAQFADQLIELGDPDAAIYAANSFAFQQGSESVLVMPDGVSDKLTGQIRERGVRIVKADVSEFYKKGGGSVKCMIGDLGNL
jgi:N-dimethylarginine dimethylaminohydrolase